MSGLFSVALKIVIALSLFTEIKRANKHARHSC